MKLQDKVAIVAGSTRPCLKNAMSYAISTKSQWRRGKRTLRRNRHVCHIWLPPYETVLAFEKSIPPDAVLCRMSSHSAMD